MTFPVLCFLMHHFSLTCSLCSALWTEYNCSLLFGISLKLAERTLGFTNDRHEIHVTLRHSSGNQSGDLRTAGKAHKPSRRKRCDYLWALKTKMPSPAWGVADVRSYGTTVWLSHFFLLLYSLLLLLFSPLLSHWHSFPVMLTVILQETILSKDYFTKNSGIFFLAWRT